MTRALALFGIAYRLRRCRRLLRAMRLTEVDRVSAAVGRDLARLRGVTPWPVRTTRDQVQPRAVEMVLNLVDSFVPTKRKAPMQTTAINAAIRPYSIAVAPELSRANLSRSFISVVLMTVKPGLRRR